MSCDGDCEVTGTVTGTGCLGHCTPGDINCYLTGPGGRQWMVSVLIIGVIVPL